MPKHWWVLCGSSVDHVGHLGPKTLKTPKLCRLTGPFTAESSTFDDNSAGEDGGALQLQALPSVNLTSCLFSFNHADGESRQQWIYGGRTV